MPPTTDEIVQTVAISQARARLATIIGISMTSGGIGKKELSANEITASAGTAWRWPANPMTQS
jgi:hypothetical protein